MYIFDSDLVWRMQLMLMKGWKFVLCVGNIKPLMLNCVGNIKPLMLNNWVYHTKSE